MFRKLAMIGKKRNTNESDVHLSPPTVVSGRRSPSPTISTIESEVTTNDGGASTALSNRSVALSSSWQESQKVPDAASGVPGLSVAYSPPNGHKVDIVFIHGLGGSSRSTWTKFKNPELFWPLTFLAMEPDLCLARILTFGYNATYKKSGNISTSILDFAKDLLFDLKYAKDDAMDELEIGKVPIIFVVHSMGGLIVKEAFMQGQNDPEYEAIIRSISAIAFLATPHRGTNLAQMLNRILQSAMITNAKEYVSELARNSLTLQKLNEQFRHIAPRLDIVSFYETQPTAIGLNKRIMILEKDSSILGYPGEISRALDADHQGICKYESPRDPNYIIVRNVLKSIVSKIITSSKTNSRQSQNKRVSLDMRTLLAIYELPVIDFSFFRDQWAIGTNEWILEDATYMSWRNSTASHPLILWISGSPGRGKSVLSSFVINKLVDENAQCQYFFIRFGDRKKQTASLLLRSLAYQIAQSMPLFWERALELAEEAIQFETASPRAIWERLFKSILFKLDNREYLYWVVDGLDEADDPKMFIRLLSDIPSYIPIRILLTSRKTNEIETAFRALASTHEQSTIHIDDFKTDFTQYIKQELCIRGSEEFKNEIIERLLLGAENNFLWLRLAVAKVNQSHRQTDIEAALQDLPIGMEGFFERFEANIAQLSNEADAQLATIILQCVTCSFRVLRVNEVSYLMGDNISQVFDLQGTIVDLCGGFVVIDNESQVVLIHQTAKEYLLDIRNGHFYIDRAASHKQLFLACLKCLMKIGLRTKLARNQKEDFVDYAATMWSSHLMYISSDDMECRSLLIKFLTGQWVLTWIQYLAMENQLRILVQASKHLSKFVSKTQASDTSHVVDTKANLELDIVAGWAIDMVKLVGKFGTSLRRTPEAIYKVIPPFCPRGSSIYQLFGKQESRFLAVSGLSIQNWDDSLSKLNFGTYAFASSISAVGNSIAVLSTSGLVFIYDAHTFAESTSSPIEHGERIYKFVLNSTASLMATYGYKTTKIWHLASGKCVSVFPNPESGSRPLHMQLADNSSVLIVASDDRKIRSLELQVPNPTWEIMADLDEPDLDGRSLNAAALMRLNSDGRLVAVFYRSHPLSAWETDGPSHLGHCWRNQDIGSHGEVIDAAWLPHSPEMLGLYMEGIIFKWSPYEDQTTELAIGASKMALNSDGALFCVGDAHGRVKVYSTADFELIYQLASPDAILSICFSPDSHRIYDVRGYYGNIWEPNALIKYAEASLSVTDGDSDISSLAPSSNLQVCPAVDSITAISSSANGKLYAYGTEKGVLTLYNNSTAILHRIHTSKAYLGIEKVCWSADGSMIAFADSSRKVIVKKLVLKTGLGEIATDLIAETIAEIPMKHVAKGTIVGIEFQNSNEHILVITNGSLHSISLQSYTVVHNMVVGSGILHWMVHPTDYSRILGIGSQTIKFLSWELEEEKVYEIRLETNEILFDLSEWALDRALVTNDGHRLLFQLRSSQQEVKLLSTQLPKTEPKTPDNSSEDQELILKPVNIDAAISSQISKCLSFTSRQRLTFISQDFSVCSVQLSLGQIKEHFPLPGDWINQESLELCRMWEAEKALLYPRNGEVAVVKCATMM